MATITITVFVIVGAVSKSSVGTGLLGRNDCENNLDGKGLWVIRGGVCGLRTQERLWGLQSDPSARTLNSERVSRQVETLPLLPTCERVPCALADPHGLPGSHRRRGGGQTERKTCWPRTVGGSMEPTGSDPWKCTRAVAGSAPGPALPAPLSPALALGTGCAWLGSCFCHLRAGPLSSPQRNGDVMRIKEDTYIRVVTVPGTQWVTKMTRTKH